MRINVVMGGSSAEYDISILSGIEAARHLVGRKDYRVRAVVIDANRLMYWHDIDTVLPDHHDFADPAGAESFNGPLHPYASPEIWGDCDVAFLALHGAYGEDGCFQGYLDTLGIRYTGSGVFASSTAMNKIAAKHIYRDNGLATPPFSLYGRQYPENTLETIIRKHGFPCFAKCPQSGSSKLLGRAGNTEELAALLETLSVHAGTILVESAIDGIEFSCGVVEKAGGSLRALPPVEIRPKGSVFFDYRAKYSDNACEEIVPAPRPESILARVQEAALRAHILLGCRGASRTDMILDGDLLYILETNTLPGLTRMSLLPKAFAAQGGTYEELIDMLIAVACTASL